MKIVYKLLVYYMIVVTVLNQLLIADHYEQHEPQLNDGLFALMGIQAIVSPATYLAFLVLTIRYYYLWHQKKNIWAIVDTTVFGIALAYLLLCLFFTQGFAIFGEWV